MASTQIHDRRQPELRWPGGLVVCPKCGGARTVHRTQQNARGVPHVVVGGQRVARSACGGKGKVRAPAS